MTFQPCALNALNFVEKKQQSACACSAPRQCQPFPHWSNSYKIPMLAPSQPTRWRESPTPPKNGLGRNYLEVSRSRRCAPTVPENLRPHPRCPIPMNDSGSRGIAPCVFRPTEIKNGPTMPRLQIEWNYPSLVQRTQWIATATRSKKSHLTTFPFGARHCRLTSPSRARMPKEGNLETARCQAMQPIEPR